MMIPAPGNLSRQFMKTTLQSLSGLSTWIRLCLCQFVIAIVKLSLHIVVMVLAPGNVSRQFMKTAHGCACVYMCVLSLSVCHYNCKSQSGLCTWLVVMGRLRELQVSPTLLHRGFNDCSVQQRGILIFNFSQLTSK